MKKIPWWMWVGGAAAAWWLFSKPKAAATTKLPPSLVQDLVEAQKAAEAGV